MKAAFDPPSIPFNRSGRLSDPQRRQLADAARKSAAKLLVAAVTFVALMIIGLLNPDAVWNVVGYQVPARQLTIAAVLALLVATVVAFRQYRGWVEIQANEVRSVEGPVHKEHVRRAELPDSWYVRVMGHGTFSASPAFYEAVPTEGEVRLFYLPKTHKPINCEPIPSRGELAADQGRGPATEPGDS